MEEDDDVVVVAHPHPVEEDRDIWWAMCNVCGTGYPIEGTDLCLSDEHNNPLIDAWIRDHVCPPEPVSDLFWLQEYGDVNRHFGLDLDAL